MSRAHWRCENETHRPANVEFQEKGRRLAWSRDPDGILIVSLLRRIAANIVAVARRLSRLSNNGEQPCWHQVRMHFLIELCGKVLWMEAFDDV